MDYEKAMEILWIKKSSIELSTSQSTPLLEALTIAIKVLEDKIISEIWERNGL